MKSTERQTKRWLNASTGLFRTRFPARELEPTAAGVKDWIFIREEGPGKR
jgi:hypothetical protein